MPTVRATLLLLCMAVLPGCAGPRLAAEAPPGVNLAGAWKLDHSASDDPQKLLEHMRAQALKIIGHPPQPVLTVPAHGGKPGQMPAQSEGGSDSVLAQPVAPGPGPHFDPLQRSPMAHIINKAVARGDFLTVRQTPDQLVLDYGGSKRTFTPGLHSVVSAEGGVGDQTSGWKGREYVIEIKAQNGPVVTEEYGLSPDGKELLVKLRVGSAELPAVSLTRVYRPTDESAPHQLPTND
jgi:hypothetical protein